MIKNIKEFNNDCQFEELNSKKEFIKSKLQHDGNLSDLKKIYFCKSDDKEKTFFEISQKDFKINKSVIRNISDCFDSITNYFLNLLEENTKKSNKEYSNINDNLDSNNYNKFIDERLFVKKFVENLINKKEESKLTNKADCIKINNDKNFENPISQTPMITISEDPTRNDNNYVYKTNIAKINPNINLRVNNKLSLFNNEKNESNNDSKQKSYKALKFDNCGNDGTDIKEYAPMSLSANIVINDWLNNLIKNNEKKYNLRFKEDVLKYLNDAEQVNFKN